MGGKMCIWPSFMYENYEKIIIELEIFTKVV